MAGCFSKMRNAKLLFLKYYTFALLPVKANSTCSKK